MFKKRIESEEMKVIEGGLADKIKKLIKIGKLREEDWKERKEDEKDDKQLAD